MKLRKLTLGLLALTGLSSVGAPKLPDVQRIEPPYWWTGMKNDTLQLIVEGKEIAQSKVSLDYKGVTLLESVSLDSPNYKLLYLLISPDAQP